MKRMYPFLLLCFFLTGCFKIREKKEEKTIEGLKAAFIYSLPLVLMDLTAKKQTNEEVYNSGKAAPYNQMMISTQYPSADFKDVVRPNADTFYNTAWLDLKEEPLVLSLPESNDRYYLYPMLSAWTNVFASPGKRTTGTKAGVYLITGPGFTGEVPPSMKEIKSPTNLVWMLGRVQVNSAEDGKNVVVPFENKVVLTPLSQYGKPGNYKGKRSRNVSKLSPNEQVEKMSTVEYFNYVNQLLVNNPPPSADKEVLEKLAKMGIKPGAKFTLDQFDKESQSEMSNIPGQVIAEMKKAAANGLAKPVNGWSMAYKNFGNYGTDYKLRAAVAYGGLGANLPEDAIYPSCNQDADGQPLSGANKYVLHFSKEEIPQVMAFWSLTMYDKEGFFVKNKLNRYTVGDRSNMKINADGSLDIFLQNDSPGKNMEANWLPAPKENFNLMLRLYWPKPNMIDGSWTPPAVRKVNNN